MSFANSMLWSSYLICLYLHVVVFFLSVNEITIVPCSCRFYYIRHFINIKNLESHLAYSKQSINIVNINCYHHHLTLIRVVVSEILSSVYR